ncbi:hypothetical protein KIPB_012102, partial [Kipferlia bialata]
GISDYATLDSDRILTFTNMRYSSCTEHIVVEMDPTYTSGAGQCAIYNTSTGAFTAYVDCTIDRIHPNYMRVVYFDSPEHNYSGDVSYMMRVIGTK